MKNKFALAVAVALASGTVAAGDYSASFTRSDADRNSRFAKDGHDGHFTALALVDDWDFEEHEFLEDDEYDFFDIDGDYQAWDTLDDRYLDASEFQDHRYRRIDEDDDLWKMNQWDDVSEDSPLDF